MSEQTTRGLPADATTVTSLPIMQVVNSDCCSGCGACAYAHGLPMRLNEYGAYIPVISSRFPHDAHPVSGTRSGEVCPFLHPELNEDALARPLYGSHCKHDSRIGFYEKVFAGHVSEGDFRTNGTSGGFGTWLGVELLNTGAVDGVIHVHASPRRHAEDPFFQYAISRTPSDILRNAKSRYHVVEMSGVLNEVRNTPGKYLFVGVPCMCKAIRRLQRLDPVLTDRIPFVMSLVCGHLKTVHWTLALAWAAGMPPQSVASFTYRKKSSSIPVTHYVFEAVSSGPPARAVVEDAGVVVGGKWNTCAMMLKACDFCDDVVGETADISIGDAWLEPYTKDSRGTNLLIVRNSQLLATIQAAADRERVVIEELSADQAAQAQAGGLRHRREGLSFRLAEAIARGAWVPTKRVQPADVAIADDRKQIYLTRMAYADASKVAFRKALDAGDYKVFLDAMKSLEARFRMLELKTGVLYSVLRYILGEKLLRKVVRVGKTAYQWVRTG